MASARDTRVFEQQPMQRQDRGKQLWTCERSGDNDGRDVFRPGDKAARSRPRTKVILRLVHDVTGGSDSLGGRGSTPFVGRLPRKKLVVCLQPVRMTLRGIEQQWTPRERLRRVADHKRSEEHTSEL